MVKTTNQYWKITKDEDFFYVFLVGKDWPWLSWGGLGSLRNFDEERKKVDVDVDVCGYMIYIYIYIYIYDILYIYIILYLVGGLEHEFIFPYIGNVIIPTDELIFFRGVETTNHIYIYIYIYIHIYIYTYIYIYIHICSIKVRLTNPMGSAVVFHHVIFTARVSGVLVDQKMIVGQCPCYIFLCAYIIYIYIHTNIHQIYIKYASK